MNTAALIVAAGLSSRMGDFKPLLDIGGVSVAQRIVSTFQQAGIADIVMITGHNAEMLESHLSGSGITFLRNEAYATTQMFDSVKIGLEFLKDRCDRILFTPVDVPLFTVNTVCSLLKQEGALICPSCHGRRGHPISITASLIPGILADSGEGGLKGALTRSGVDMIYLSVEDIGTLKDADTPEDFSALLKLHAAREAAQ